MSASESGLSPLAQRLAAVVATSRRARVALIVENFATSANAHLAADGVGWSGTP
ncbi:hypothetical protein [Pseudonocardia acidicola]|uniref:Uncharacterized protein n=1 Tax=Pseudonocardia acidicola TaxID=2724939 RepID=A0ABX1S5Z6_9PSEU|nr:hypothetical protein [Pseudonocardia acidicola]NMH96995.1 hypothetical protein [Pseudonocardia acidicola]